MPEGQWLVVRGWDLGTEGLKDLGLNLCEVAGWRMCRKWKNNWDGTQKDTGVFMRSWAKTVAAWEGGATGYSRFAAGMTARKAKTKAVRALHEYGPHLKIEMWGTQHSAGYSRFPLGMTARKAKARAGLLRERLKVRFTFSGLCHFFIENPIQ
jgi:hypothetical protein